MGQRSALGEILEPLYAGALDSARLTDFCQLLCEATGSHIGTVMVHDGGHASGRMELMVGADELTMHAYEAEFARDNIWINRTAHRMRRGVMLNSDDAASRVDLRKSRYYNEYLRHLDVEQSIALCAQADDEGLVLATLSRSGALRPYSHRDVSLAIRVAPHWANAYAIQRRLSWLSQRVESLEAAIEYSPLGMVMLDRNSRVLRSNAAAESMFSEGNAIRLQAGYLVESNNDGRLQRCLGEATTGTLQEGQPQRRASKVMLCDASGRDMLVARAHPLTGIGHGAAAILFLQPVGEHPGRDLALSLRELYGLTRSESGFAAALQATGDTARAAHRCGISVSTAQARLKLIYDKTGEHGLPALMRLLCAIASATD